MPRRLAQAAAFAFWRPSDPKSLAMASSSSRSSVDKSPEGSSETAPLKENDDDPSLALAPAFVFVRCSVVVVFSGVISVEVSGIVPLFSAERRLFLAGGLLFSAIAGKRPLLAVDPPGTCCFQQVGKLNSVGGPLATW